MARRSQLAMIAAHQCVSEVLAEILRLQPLSPAKVSFAWRTAVGPALDRATSVDLRLDGRLRVRAADPRWRREVQRSRDLILQRLQRLLGPDVVRGIEL